MKTDTAHRAWDAAWSTQDGRADWLVPEPDVTAVAADLAARDERVRALDIGCGVGRHALQFARLGFETFAVDLAETGLSELRRNAEREGLEIAAQTAAMTALPFPDDHFDYVLAFNVLYHGDPAIVAAAVDEIARVIKPGGTYQGTMLSKRNTNFGVGTEVAPNTFVRATHPDDPDDGDKDHPHFYCDAAELVALFGGFELVSLNDRTHRKPGSWHWYMLAERRPHT